MAVQLAIPSVYQLHRDSVSNYELMCESVVQFPIVQLNPISSESIIDIQQRTKSLCPSLTEPNFIAGGNGVQAGGGGSAGEDMDPDEV